MEWNLNILVVLPFIVAGNKYAIVHIRAYLQSGPKSLPRIKDHLSDRMGYMQPTTMEIVGMLKRRNGFEKDGNGNYRNI